MPSVSDRLVINTEEQIQSLAKSPEGIVGVCPFGDKRNGMRNNSSKLEIKKPFY